MGLGRVVPNDLDRLLLAGAFLGLFTDLFVNPLFRFMESSEKEYNNYMMFPFPFKKYWTFFTNIIYYIAVTVIVMYIYSGINQLLVIIFERYEGYVSLGVEPLIYGVFCLIVDMAFIGIKDLIVYLVKRAKSKKKEAEDV